MFCAILVTHILVQIVRALEAYKSKEKKTFGFLHCWTTLHLHQKWTNRSSQKKYKTASNSSPGTSTLGTNSSRHDDEAEALTSQDEPSGSEDGRDGNHFLPVLALEHVLREQPFDHKCHIQVSHRHARLLIRTCAYTFGPFLCTSFAIRVTICRNLLLISYLFAQQPGRHGVDLKEK